MIKIQTLDLINNIEHIVKPTIFPDGTSQVWKLPEEIINSLNVKVTWNFEAERELIDLASLRKLFTKNTNIHVHIPYLPYARQDKQTSNNLTFNLKVFALFLNSLKFNIITAVDVHNEYTTGRLIQNFKNIKVDSLINTVLKNNLIIYPDDGASLRYDLGPVYICCQKTREQSTGEISSHRIYYGYPDEKITNDVIIIDDICDGGATFISVAKMLKKQNEEVKVNLFVTHGIFSKGKQVLYDAGINNIYTTNSLLKNEDGFKV